jgi:L-asparaginase
VPAAARVHVIALGGTIAMAPGGAGGVPELSGEDLLRSVPPLADVADVTARTLQAAPGASLTFSVLLSVAEDARAAVRAGAVGVVVTQGTDTIEETAYFLDLVWDQSAPLVVTGAMRLAGTPGADGPANILSAVTLAVDPGSRDRGVLVAFGDEVHAARRVVKVHSARLAAFASSETGPVGRVLEGRVAFWAPPAHRPAAIGGFAGPAPQVALLPVVLGDTGSVLQASVPVSAGIVLAAMGAGHVPAPMLGPIEAAAAAVPVAFSSRTGAGPVLRHTYGFRGSERDLHRIGLLDAGDLPPLKARVLLVAALWSERDRDAQRRVFAAHALP